MKDTWHLVHAERTALIEDLSGLTEAQWAQASLCGGWTVHDVAAHLVDNAKTTPFGIVRVMFRARFNFDRQNDQGVARERGASPGKTLERLRAVVHRTSTPPAPLDSRLVEEVVHGEDIRRPLGLRRDYPSATVERALRYQARTSVAFGGGKQRVAAVRLEAVDADVSLGEGPVAQGPALSLLMVVSGRTEALADLTGPGVARLS